MSAEYLCNPLHYVEAMRHKHPQLLNDWCCTELSHVLDFSGSDGLGQVLAGVVDLRQGKTFVKKFSRNKQRANSQSGVFGAPLTEEAYCQARQLIDFIKDNMNKEGIFRIPGNSERQRRLKDKINSGLLVDLNNDVFTPHDVACVLKTFLGDLPEPLLTDKHYPAHVQAADLTYQMDEVPSVTEEMGRKYRAQRTHDHVTALRYLFLMLPPVNFKLLREILELLFSIAEQEKTNKMSAFNLGVMFAPHILWPRYLTTDDLRDQVFIKKLNCGVEFMITRFHQIFKVPAKMLKRCEQYIKHGKLLEEEDVMSDHIKPEDECDNGSKIGLTIGAPETPTVEVKQEQNQTEAALSRLYASVQDMPPSSKKRKLIKQFARNSNMPGTPTKVKEDMLLRSQEQHSRQRRHTRSKSAGDTCNKHARVALSEKKRRPAPDPPVEHDKTVQQKHMRDVRHEMIDQLRRNRAQSCNSPSTMKVAAARSAQPGMSSMSSVSPAVSRQKRKAPLTPKQLEEQQLSATPKSSGAVKPVPAVRSSIRSRKRQGDGRPPSTAESEGSAIMRPVPKPRKERENGQVSSGHHGHGHPQPRIARKHELHSLV